MKQVNIIITETPLKLEIKTVPPRRVMSHNTPHKEKEKIKFNLTSASYSFPDNPAEAIKFKVANNQFDPPTQGPNPKKNVEVMDANNDGKQYEYIIKVIRDVDGKELFIDPLIKNR